MRINVQPQTRILAPRRMRSSFPLICLLITFLSIRLQAPLWYNYSLQVALASVNSA
jgi:hypothetical protein